MHPRVCRGPVIGDAKAIEVRVLMRKTRHMVLVAIGDTASDSQMGLESLKNGGVFISVGDDYENARRTFHPLVQMATELGVKNPEKKVLYVEY